MTDLGFPYHFEQKVRKEIHTRTRKFTYVLEIAITVNRFEELEKLF